MRKSRAIQPNDERQGEAQGSSCIAASSCDNSVVAGNESAAALWPDEDVAGAGKWKDQETSITLTNDQWTLVEVFLDYGVQDRKAFIETIDRLNRILYLPGQEPANYVKFLMDQILDVDKIIKKIHKRT